MALVGCSSSRSGGIVCQGGLDQIPGTSSTRIKKYPRRNRQLLNYLATRNWMPYTNCNVANLARNHRPFLNRMNLMKKLPVHDGCVNTICWNKTGEYILSGSDDCNLCITKPTYLFDDGKDYTVLHKVPTRHLGNIFSAQFIPYSGDALIVSCSSEGPVIVHDINSHEPSEGLLKFNCHSSTIYEVVTIPDNDKVFLSCGEDKTIRLFDMRVHNSCARAGTCPHPALIRNSSAMTTLNLHPLNSNLLLVGRADGMGLVYDRRKLPDVTKFSRERAHTDRLAGSTESFFKYVHPLEGVVSQFTVPDMEEKCRFTSLCFNADGTEVLASYSGDYVYLFNHDKSSNFELVQTLPKKTKSDPTTNDGNAANESKRIGNQTNERSGRPATDITRIRVRGDWSDTGINSVPHSRMRQTNPNPHQVTTFWQHMADVALSLSTRQTGARSRFVPTTEILAFGSASNNSDDDQDQQQRQQQQERIEEEDEENSTVVDDGEAMNEDEDEDDDDDDDDDEDNGDDDDSNSDADGDENAFGRFAEITVEGLVNDATELVGNNRDTSRGSDKDDHASKSGDKNERIKVSAQTKMKFRKTLAGLKNKFNQIPTYHPRVKYQGHRNSRTSIKEAIFWGDDYIMSGSDCGRIMIWEKETAKIVMGFPADERVVNCLAPNPHHYALASSGIDYDIKLWSTQSLLEGPLRVSDDEMKKIVENNELMLEESKQTISVPPHLFFRVLASLAHINNNNNSNT